MGINAFLKLGFNINIATNNIINNSKKCKNYGIENIFASGLTINNLQHSNFINAVKNALKLNCVKYVYIFIENCNIVLDYLCARRFAFEQFWKG